LSLIPDARDAYMKKKMQNSSLSKKSWNNHSQPVEGAIFGWLCTTLGWQHFFIPIVRLKYFNKNDTFIVLLSS